jgi:hypothetical protein
LVEQLTLNQLVEGSNPSRPTKKFKELAFDRLAPFLLMDANASVDGQQGKAFPWAALPERNS